MKRKHFIAFGWDAYSEIRIAFVRSYGIGAMQNRWQVRRLLGMYFVRIKS